MRRASEERLQCQVVLQQSTGSERTAVEVFVRLLQPPLLDNHGSSVTSQGGHTPGAEGGGQTLEYFLFSGNIYDEVLKAQRLLSLISL